MVLAKIPVSMVTSCMIFKRGENNTIKAFSENLKYLFFKDE